LNSLGRFSKKPEILNFTKTHPMGAELFHTGRPMEKHDKFKLLFIILQTHLKSPRAESFLRFVYLQYSVAVPTGHNTK
jgi:hypothetical protein